MRSLVKNLACDSKNANSFDSEVWVPAACSYHQFVGLVQLKTWNEFDLPNAQPHLFASSEDRKIIYQSIDET